ncbi:MAG: S-methyl-5-thioribose-1-phosphate isomerase [Desulfotignum sp.]
MNVDGKQMRPIWFDKDTETVRVIDQRFLPHQFIIKDLTHVDEVIHAIQEMVVRGAPLIGATGAMGVYVILVQEKSLGMDDTWFSRECDRLKNARPTATNLRWGVNRVQTKVLEQTSHESRIQAALTESLAIMEEEADNCRQIGVHGLTLIQEIAGRKPGQPVNILTHCNAGWLACIEYGTATAPIYTAHDAGIPVHVWVDETRPLNQGARLTAWELGKHGIPHTVITDNAGGHLMQHDQVDLVIVGTDRTTRAGDVANKIGTYLKALAARDNDIPFYVALPVSTFDWDITDGIRDIPIEERDPDEIRYVQGWHDDAIFRVQITPEDSPAANHAFDVTPARLVTGFITERGMCDASENAIKKMYPDQFKTD